MNNQFFLAESLIHEFKGEDYIFGLGVLNYAHDHISDLLSTINRRVSFSRSTPFQMVYPTY